MGQELLEGCMQPVASGPSESLVYRGLVKQAIIAEALGIVGMHLRGCFDD